MVTCGHVRYTSHGGAHSTRGKRTVFHLAQTGEGLGPREFIPGCHRGLSHTPGEVRQCEEKMCSNNDGCGRCKVS